MFVLQLPDGAPTSRGAQARPLRFPEAKRARQEVAARSWGTPSDLCTRCRAHGHRSKNCTSTQRAPSALARQARKGLAR